MESEGWLLIVNVNNGRFKVSITDSLTASKLRKMRKEREKTIVNDVLTSRRVNI